jgi:hypothetical protein
MIWYAVAFIAGALSTLAALWGYLEIMDRREQRWILPD